VAVGGWLRRHRPAAAITSAVLLALVAFVLVYFQPQKLFIDDEVNETLPFAVATASAGGESTTPTAAPASTPAAAAVLLASGPFRSGEHRTTGDAQLLELPDGGRLLRLVSLRTSNGPALRVWLSAAASTAGNGAVASARHVDLGGLKGNIGSQNYQVPDSVDLDAYSSAVVWCERFSVTFGAAPLR
jgi:hypothetical protein